MKIGVFDSGFGGLNILKNITEILPEYDYIYLGDSARTPYGSRSQEVIYDYTEQAVNYLFQKNCQLIILACNTASTEALPKIQQQYLPQNYPTRRVLGVIVPTVEEAVRQTSNNSLGLIATESTVNSNSFFREIQKIDPQTKLFSKACPLLVPLVESGEDSSEILKPILHKYLKPILVEGVDSLILGCTHYGLLEKEIQKVISELNFQTQIISEGKIVAEKLADYLLRHPEIETQLSKNKKRDFFTTDLTEKFQILGSRFFGSEIKIQKIKLN